MTRRILAITIVAALSMVAGVAVAQTVTCSPLRGGRDLIYTQCQIHDLPSWRPPQAPFQFIAPSPGFTPGARSAGMSLIGWRARFISGSHELSRVSIGLNNIRLADGGTSAEVDTQMVDMHDDAPALLDVYFYLIYPNAPHVSTGGGGAVVPEFNVNLLQGHGQREISLGSGGFLFVAVATSGSADSGYLLSGYSEDFSRAHLGTFQGQPWRFTEDLPCALAASVLDPQTSTTECGAAKFSLQGRPDTIQGTITRKISSDPILHQVGPFQSVDTVKIPGPVPAGAFSVLKSFDVHLVGPDATHISSLSAGASSTDFDPVTNEMHIHWLFDFPNDTGAPYDFSATMQHVLIR